MLRILWCCCGVLLAAEPSATELAADLISVRAGELSQRGEVVVAGHLQQLAAGVRAGRISLIEAQQVLAVAHSLPPAGSPPPSAMTIEQAGAALDGGPLPPPTVAPVPPPSVSPPPQVIGQVLAIEPGTDGKPALLALATDASAGVQVGRRLAIRRGDMTIAVARVSAVKPDLTIALLIPGTWHDDQAEIRVNDAVVLLPE